jgi:hypothetical protein
MIYKALLEDSQPQQACLLTSPNNPKTNFLSHTTSLLASLAAMYSTSAALCEMDPYFRLDQEVIADPKFKQYLEVLF